MCLVHVCRVVGLHDLDGKLVTRAPLVGSIMTYRTVRLSQVSTAL